MHFFVHVVAYVYGNTLRTLAKELHFILTEGPRIMAPNAAGLAQIHHHQPQMRSPTPAGAPIILAPRMPQFTPTSATGLVNGGPPPLVSPTEAGLLYPYSEYPMDSHLLPCLSTQLGSSRLLLVRSAEDKPNDRLGLPFRVEY